MLDTFIGLLPLAVGLGVFAAVVAFLIAREMAIGAWLVAAFLIGHGLVHVMFVAPQPATAAPAASGVPYPFDLARSWLVGTGLDVTTVRTIGGTLTVLVVVGYALAALATVDLVVPAAWWGGLTMAATVASVALLIVALTPGIVLGLAIDVVLTWLVIASVWVPRTRFALGG